MEPAGLSALISVAEAMEMAKTRAIQNSITSAILAVALLLAAATITARTQKANASDPGTVPASIEITAETLMTSTVTAEYSPIPGSHPAFRLYASNESAKGIIDDCARTYSCERDGHRLGDSNIGDMTSVIYPSGESPFTITSGIDLPIGYKLPGRGGRPGDTSANPVNLSGAADAGTETIRFCYEGIFISDIADTCKWARQISSGDSFWGGTDPGRGVCPHYGPGEGGIYGTNSGEGPPHISMITNDAGPVNRTWGPIPGDTGNPDDYGHPHGQLWDARRQRWAHARWSVVTCAGLTVGGIAGNIAFVHYRSIFIYKDDPVPGAVTLSILNGADDRVGSQSTPTYNPDSWARCSALTSQPPNPCRVSYEVALATDLGATGKPIGTTWSTCGNQSIGHAASDRVTWPEHATASRTTSIRVPCQLSGKVSGSSGQRVSVFRTSDGAQAATGFTDSSGRWSLTLPQSLCPAGGYKIMAEAPAGYRPKWYPDSDNYTSAGCVSSPASDINSTLTEAAAISGNVRSEANGAAIDGASVYAFRASDGSYSGSAITGRAGSAGHFTIALSPGEAYRLKIIGPSGYAPVWHGAETALVPGFVSARSVHAPSTADTHLLPSGHIQGYTKDAATSADLSGVQLYAWRASDGSFAGSARSGVPAPGRYLISAEQGTAYKVLARAGASHEDRWGNGAPGYIETSPVVTPGALNFSLREAAWISGQAPTAGSLVSAYTSCGCTSPANVISAQSGSYALKVASTAASGWQYKIRFMPSGLPASWHAGSSSFSGASPVSAPSTGIDP